MRDTYRRRHQMVLACWEFHEKLILVVVPFPFSTSGKNSCVGGKKSGSYTARLHTSDD